jgi:hypothetical protein
MFLDKPPRAAFERCAMTADEDVCAVLYQQQFTVHAFGERHVAFKKNVL